MVRRSSLLVCGLAALSCDEKQRFRVFKRVDQTAQEGLSRLFPAGRKPRASSVFTPHTDHMRLCDEYQLLREDEEDEEDEEHDEQGNDPPAPAQPKTSGGTTASCGRVGSSPSLRCR